MQNQHTETAAARKHFAEADAELNKVYAQLMAKLPAERKTLLKNAQRAWIAFRDAHGKFVGSEMAGGSAEPMLYDGARAAATRDRIAELKGILNS